MKKNDINVLWSALKLQNYNGISFSLNYKVRKNFLAFINVQKYYNLAEHMNSKIFLYRANISNILSIYVQPLEFF